MLSQLIACKSPNSLMNGRVLVGNIGLTSPEEQRVEYYREEPVPIPAPTSIRQPSAEEREVLAANPGELHAIHLFRPPRSLGREALKAYSATEHKVLHLAGGLIAKVTILSAAANQLSTSVSKRHGDRKPGLHQDMQATPTFAAGLCLKGSRYIVVGDVSTDDVAPELLEENTIPVRDQRRAAFREVVQRSLKEGEPRECVFLRIDEGEMYSGLCVSKQAHDGSSWHQDTSSLALMLTNRPLPPDAYDHVL